MRDEWTEKPQYNNDFFKALPESANARKSLQAIDEAYTDKAWTAKALAASVITGEDFYSTPAAMRAGFERYNSLWKDARRRRPLRRWYSVIRGSMSGDELRAFRKAVADDWWPLLPSPAQVTPRELREEATEAVNSNHCDQIDEGGSVDYAAALYEIASNLSQQCRRPLASRPRPVAIVRGPFHLNYDTRVIWSNNHAAISYSSVVSKRFERFTFTVNPDPSYRLVTSRSPRIIQAQLEGYFTSAALKTAAHLLASQLSSLLSLVSPSAKRVRIGDLRLPIIQGDVILRERSLLKDLFSELYAPSPAKPTLSRQIRTCTLLLVTAEQQCDAAAYFSLASASLEALLATPRDVSITQWLAEVVATLLEPDPHRRLAAVMFFKKLYNIRSRIVHGDSVTVSETERLHFRIVIFSCLKRLLAYRDFIRSSGLDDSTEAFHRELLGTKFTATQFGIDLDELPARKLWCETS